jgi:sec-independent protein translocase protein TatC
MDKEPEDSSPRLDPSESRGDDYPTVEGGGGDESWPPATPTEVVDEDEGEGGPVKSFLEHLEDLRWVIIRVVAALVVAMVACMAGAPKVVEFLRWPLLISGATVDGRALDLQPLGPLGPFIIVMKLALYGGITLALPFIFYFVADYVMPALKKHEKAFFLRAFIVGAGLFLLGVMVAYFFALPLTLKAMVQFSSWMGFDPSFWRAEEYFSFVIMLMVAMGLSFELPIVMLSLVKLGLIQVEWLVKGRPYFFLGSFTLVAIITPDFVSTFFLVIPMVILMEICIWIAWWWKRKETKEALQSRGRD